MPSLEIIKHSSLDKLKSKIADNLFLYENGEIDGIIKAPDYIVRKTFISLDAAATAEISAPSEEDHDIKNCLFISNAYKNLTPQQAGDERVWAYATHVIYSKYVHLRWPMPKEQQPKESADDFKKRQIQHVKAHYFVQGNRGLVRDNAISRLWWMGYIAKRCDKFSHEETLRVLLKKSDVRANIIERPNLNMSKEIFNQIIDYLQKDFAKGDNVSDNFYNRTIFRDFMKYLNRVGGMRALNALSEESLSKLMLEIKNEVME